MRPRAGWYALPAVLLLAASAGFLGVLACTWEDVEAADGPVVSGDPRIGVTVRLAEGRTYFVYVREHASSPYRCAVALAGASGPLRLTRENSWSAAGHPGYRYTATFKAPLTGPARLTCRGEGGGLLVTPDGTVRTYRGLAFLGAVGVAGPAVLAIAVIAVTRRRSAGRARAAAG
ncbi:MULTISPECIES: hypothetical protein [Thermomonosporaceae]|uniref:hypothetical protein n=1 Tax=Thermomonosporaceae TaxID=2012 RepID=UPI00255A767C|nr:MULTISPECIES: hypothetical protein [Thermomonosporaceae]MDL4770975.1 hypothetical protein [Actinomadura xylanilytica]